MVLPLERSPHAPATGLGVGLGSEVEPHTPGDPPPPHVWVPEHVPQLATVRGLPQLSLAESGPQLLASREQSCASVSGTHSGGGPLVRVALRTSRSTSDTSAVLVIP